MIFAALSRTRKLAEELRRRFESYIGKPKGEPVIR